MTGVLISDQAKENQMIRDRTIAIFVLLYTTSATVVSMRWK
jgi:hypothetical protein